MKLVYKEDIIKAAKLNGFGGKGAAKILMLLLKLNKVNRIYSEISHKKGIDFINSVISELEIKFEVSEEELNRIPKEGAFITVSNHPYGGIEGIILIKILSHLRPDYKFLANYLLKRLKPIQDYFLTVNPFETRKKSKSSLGGIKDSFTHLNNGSSLGIFPAGEVSTYDHYSRNITDRQWQYPILKFIKKSSVPIVPIYFQGSNSRVFHLLGLIHPVLRTVKLPSELFNKRNKIIRIRIGNPISIKEQNEFKDISRYGRYLRTKTYALGTSIEIKNFFSTGLKRKKKVEIIIDPIPIFKIQKEIKRSLNDYLLFKSKNFNVICAPSIEIPNITSEIGRLRELAFREVGEGTNRRLDIDEFDLYFHQLFIWDEEAKKIVGAYRVGKGKEIFNQYGIKGFYIQSLFKINKQFFPFLEKSIELGRSFITKEYQKKLLPLFLLWKGILYFLIKHPEYRYLIGPVSISNRFSEFSKGVIIKFIMENYYNYEFAEYFKPRKKFKVPINNIDTDILFENTDDINKLDKFIKDVEISDFNIPVLLKKYIKLNGKIIGFNVDPKFNQALDGLLILDLYDVPIQIITALSKEINDETILDRFYSYDISYLNNISQF